MNRRSHNRIKRELPPELLEAINQMLVNEGCTYQEITDFLKKQGHHISRSAVGRYGKNFAERLERIKLFREKMSTIAESVGEESPMKMAEGANQIAIQMLTESLMNIPDLDGENPMNLIKSIALLERTGTMRERLKLASRKKAEEAIREVEERIGGSLTSEELKHIKEMIYGIAE